MNLSFIREMILDLATKPKILHRLPGRIRIHVPFMNKATEEARKIADSIVGLVESPEEIISVEPNYITSNILIHYDEGLISEKGILALFRNLVMTVNRYWDKITTVPPDETETVANRITVHLKEHFSGGWDIDERIQLPDDIW